MSSSSLRGLRRGRLVQFDKGDVGKLEDLRRRPRRGFRRYAGGAGSAQARRRGVPRLARSMSLFTTSGCSATKLRRSIMAGFRESWRVRNMTDERDRRPARSERLSLSLLFLLLALVPLATPALFIFAWPGRIWWRSTVWALPAARAPYPAALGPGRPPAPLRTAADEPALSCPCGPGPYRRVAHRLGPRPAASPIPGPSASSGAPWRYFLHLPLSSSRPDSTGS